MAFQLITKAGSMDLNAKTYVMGILNVTPDSFSDGGKYNQLDIAVEKAIEIEKAGADIIDIGGESTRPGFEPVSEEEEIERVVPIIKAVKQAVGVPLSIDTYKAKTAKHALEAGVSIINDIWGAKYDPEMAKVAANYQVPIILTHNRGNQAYTSLMDEVVAELEECIEIVHNAGVKKENIILDPGIGFAKTADENLLVMRHMDRIADMGYPTLLGSSRKSMIGKVLDLPADQRDEGTGATVCYGITKGANIVRVHNVDLTVKMTKMMDAMMGKGGN